MKQKEFMLKAILDYINQEFVRGEPKLSGTDNLLLSGVIDSLGVMKLVGFVEQKFDISIPPQDITIDNFMSVEALVSYLNKD